MASKHFDQITETILGANIDPRPGLAAEIRRRDLCDAYSSRNRCRDFYTFVKEAWHVLEPNTSFVPNWHIEAKCMHLQAISEGKLGNPPRLMINEPGGFAKSLVTSVLWQAWEWGPFGRPDMRYFTTSYQEGYATRDARRTRDVIQSEWYQARWPVRLLRVGEKSFENGSRGYREAVPFSRLTAGRGNRVIIDDPHSTEQAESQTERNTTSRIFRESVQDRLNDPEKDAIIIIMHRLHREDLCGVIETLDLPFTKLTLPMEFEKEKRCRTYDVKGDLFWEDPRTEEGELLFPARMNQRTVDNLKKAMGTVAVSGKLQQQPTPREGALMKRRWFDDKIIQEEDVPKGTVFVRHYDLAATKHGGARTAGLKMGKTKDGRFIVMNCRVCQEEGAEVRRFIQRIAEADGKRVHISLPQDPGQAGKAQAQDFITQLAGYRAKAAPETGSKEARAEPFAAQLEAGNVLLVQGDWTEAYIDELCDFPNGKFKDRVDATSGAFLYLVTEKISTYTLDNL